MWLYKEDKFRESEVYDLNFLFKQDKFYIMDNHLAAAWCWIQKLDPKEQYGFFHIDRHYDLLDNLSKDLIVKNKSQLTGSIEEYLDVKWKDNIPAVRFDNYIDVFRKLYPNILTKYYFATHNDGTYLDEIQSYKPDILELFNSNNISYWTNTNNQLKWVLNLDLDYFFYENKGQEFQFLTDQYITSVCKGIEKAWSNIDVVTLALSPGFCGGWEPAFRVLKLITDYFSINFPYEWMFSTGKS